MFTDIVGYTRIMGEDDQKALQLLRKNRSIHQSTINRHHGKWLKEMGDGTLASFNTTTDAVYCAGELIKICDSQGIELRIGIHQGEITEEGGDIFGDGVNIASRIEPLAHPGQILVSAPVHQNVKNQAGITTQFLKEAALKNVDEPISIYDLSVDFSSYVPAPKVISDPPAKKSIAVLPFRNLSSNEDDQHFADGVMEAVINQLSGLEDLRVSSYTSTTKYRNSEQSIQEIGDELEVTYILEGSFQKIENQLRITAKIINVSNNESLWSQQYDEQVGKNFFNIMTNVAKSVTSQLRLSLTAAEEQYLNTNPTVDFSAYDLYMRGRSSYGNYLTFYQSEDLFAAEEFYRHAIAIDSSFALGYVGLGEVSTHKRQRWKRLSVEAEAHTDSIMFYAAKALELDPNLATAYALRGQYFQFTGQIEKAIEDQEEAISINPNLTEPYMNLGIMWLDEMKDPVKAFFYYNTAMIHEKNGILLPDILYQVGMLFGLVGNYEKSKEMFNYGKKLRPGTELMDFPVVWNNILQGKFEEGIEYANSICGSENESSFCGSAFFFLHFYMEDFDKIEQPIKPEKESYDEPPVAYEEGPPGNPMQAAVYMETGRKEEAIEMMQKLVDYNQSKGSNNWEPYGIMGEYEKCLEELLKMEKSDPYATALALVQHYFPFKPLSDNPEFQAMIERVEIKKAEARKQIETIENASVAGSNTALNIKD